MAFQWILQRVEYTDKIELSRDEGVYTVGRGKENTIKCLSLYVSRKHCKILQRDGNLTIVDSSSANGTFVNQTRILPEREIPLQNGDLIGIGVCETTDSSCFVFQLYQKVFQNVVPQVPTLPDSSTNEHEIVIIMDSDSETGPQESGEAQAKETKKRPAENQPDIKAKVSRLENTTTCREPSSDLAITHANIDSLGVKGSSRRPPKDSDNKLKRPPGVTSTKKTALDREVREGIPKCEKPCELESSVNSSNRSRTVLDTDAGTKLVGDLSSSCATNSKCVPVTRLVKNKLESEVEPVSITSEVSDRIQTNSVSHSATSSVIDPCVKRFDSTAVCIEKQFYSEPLSVSKAITSIQTTKANPDMLSHFRTDSETMNSTVICEPLEVTKCKSDEIELFPQYNVKNTVGKCFGNDMLNSRTNENEHPPVNKKEIHFVDNSSLPMFTYGMDKRSKDDQELLVYKESTENASKQSNEMQSLAGDDKFMSIGLSKVNKVLGIDNAEHTANNLTGDSRSVCTNPSTTLESHLTSEGAKEGGLHSAIGSNAIPEADVEIEEVSVPFPTFDKVKSECSSPKVEISDSRKLPNSGEIYVQNKLGRKRKPSKTQKFVPESYSTDFKKVDFKCEKVSKPEQDLLLDNQELKAESIIKEKPREKELNVTEQIQERAQESSSTLVSKESGTTSSDPCKSSALARDEHVGRNKKSHKLKDAEILPTDCHIVKCETDDDDDDDDDLISMRLQEVLYSDHSKAKTHVTCDDTLDDSDDFMTKQKTSKPRRLIVFESSSSSNEDDVLPRNQKKLESTRQSEGDNSTGIHLFKGKRKLSCTSEDSNDSDIKLVTKNSTDFVTGFKIHSVASSTQSGVDSVNENKESNITQGNVKGIDDEVLVAAILKNKAVVKLERLDEDVLKSSGIVSVPKNEPLNYTLDEDIIVVSDDDEYFPSSQIFDDYKPSTSALKTEGQDATHEESSFNKVREEDDDASVFEDDDSDLDDDQWFKRLSQQEIEPEPMAEVKESEKEVTLSRVTLNNEGIERELKIDELPEDLMKTDDVTVKQREPFKPKYAVIIDAPPMPPRKAFQRGISAKVATRMYKEQTEVYQQPVKPRSVISDGVRKKECKPKKKEIRVKSSDDISNLTANQKKQIADKRKEKLKAISEKEKAAAAALKKNSTKVPAKVIIKVTDKNRGAFLTEGAEDTYNVTKGSETAQTSVLSSAVKNLHINREKCQKVNVPEQESVKSSGPQPKKRESRSASAPTKSIKDLPRIPKLSDRPSTSKSVDLEVHSSKSRSGVEMETVLPDTPMPALRTNAFPTPSIIKTLAPTRSRKEKKRVHFKKESELVEVRIIPVAEDSRLLPVARQKDAPTPRKVSNNQFEPKGPDFEEVLYDILCWNPKWLEEQRNKSATEPPPVHGDKLWPMLSSFLSYKDYLKILTPLLLLELWTGISKESENNPSDPRKNAVVVGIDQVDTTPCLTLNKKQLMHISCHAVLTELESQKQLHPRLGDLVYLELELENEMSKDHHDMQSQSNAKQRRIVPIFAYVKSLNKEAVTGRTSVHKEILKHSARPTTKLTLVLLAKFRPYDVKTSHAMRIKVVSYIRSELRLFQAMAHLPSSPLFNYILKPAEQNFSLPDPTNRTLVPLIKQDLLNEPQKRAILATAHACLKSEPKICLIQGPPGTGKSHVIVNLIIQIMYGQKQYRKHGIHRNVRILVCAPSNAAIDELVIRLLHIRQTIQKEERFRMVRTGRQETMNPLVKDISVVELAKRDARNTAQSLESVESLDLEIRNLEARKNSLVMILERAREKNLTDNIRETEFKLGETERKLLQMKKSKTQNTTLSPREIWRLERDAQSRILLGADIVATTLSSCFNNQMETIFTTNNKDKSAYQFTCCIVDEATQSQELETLIPLMLGVTTLVLVGDAKQLPATVLSKVAKENGLGKSLFARLQTCFEDSVKNPTQFLGIQYRMHPDICLWPNRFFYNGRLHSSPNLAQQRVSPLVPYCILSLEYKQHDSGELSNAGEAELVSQLTIGILEKLGNQKLSIGIITPYHKQRTMLMSLLQVSSFQNVDVNTIDSFQGQERDIIVFSCVRTGGVGFLADSQRLNVAMTRARHSLLLCGNFTSLRSDNMWRALLENAKQRNVLKHVSSSVAKNKDELLKLVLREK